MSYDIVKAGIAGRLNALGYEESSNVVDFNNAPATEYGNRYILKALTGENLNDQIRDRFDDKQEWQILIAFDRSEFSDVISLDASHRAKDTIIKDLDKPANWEAFVKLLKYETWAIIETPNYFVLDIRLNILDEFIHG